MMKSVAVLLVVTVLAHCLPKKPIDYRSAASQTQNSQDSQDAPKECTKGGAFCESCTSLVACVEKGNNFTKAPLGTCKSPQKCLNGACVSDIDPFCDGVSLAFPCQTVGIFPDPFYCNKFVLCVDAGKGKLQAYVNECQQGYGYNVVTDLCDVALEKGQCPEENTPVPICQNVGQSEALKGKCAMYYICEQYSSSNDVLYPVLDVCPGGVAYDNYYCGTGQSATT